jgi:hypothetical protein
LPLLIVFGVFAVVACACASPRGLVAFVVTFIGCALLVTTVAVLQAVGPMGCFLGADDDWQGKGELRYDGRPCETIADCRKEAPIPDGNYRCEQVGPLETSTIGLRVRYRGSLADPNELSLMISAAVPLTLALAEVRRRKRRAEGAESEPAPGARARGQLPFLVSDGLIERFYAFLRAIPVWLIIGAFGTVVVLSKSRGGLLVFLLVVGIHFIRRIGAWGVVAGCVVGPPMILFGGRSGAEADHSSNERTELLREAFEFIRRTKGIGLGVGQFPDASSIGLTAHNAYVLAAAETGLVGMILFGLGAYLAIKVPYVIWFGDFDVSRSVARFAPALAVTMTGMLVGIFLLSWTYKDILWMLFGASAALYGAARADDPRVKVGITVKEVLLVGVGMFAMLAVAYVATRFRPQR